MNPDNTVEYNSLSWVKSQLDDVLSEAQSSLNDYIEDREDEHLTTCIERLQLIYGTLQMVEVYGAAMLTEEMQKTSVAVLEGEVERAEDAFDVLMRAMLQLPDYLEKIQAGHKDAPITLMPIINDLRSARKEGLLTESVLFSPELVNVKLEASSYDASSIEAGKLQGEAKRLRTHYQLGLLDFIRNKKERAGLQRIKAVLSSLEKVSSNDEVRHFWMVVGALAEGLLKEGIDTNLSIKMLLGAVDRQLKLLLDIGEEKFSESYSKELITNVLYYVGLSDVESASIDAVKEAYLLDELIPHDMTDPASAIGGLNADLFDTVSVGITEDLNKVKDVLELFMHGDEQNLDDLVPVAEQLGKIADTYGMLGMGAVRQSIMEQRDALDSVIKSGAVLSERLVLNIASELLQAESELKDYIAARSGFIDMNRDSENQTVPAAEYRQVVLTVVAEALKNFTVAKETILAYVNGLSEKDSLDVIYQRLEEVRGVSMMLPLGRVETLIVRLQEYIHVALIENNHKPDDAEQDTVADVVTAIEYFFEALSEGRPGVEQGLNAGDEAAQKLDAVTRSYSPAAANIPDVTSSPDVISPAEAESEDGQLEESSTDEGLVIEDAEVESEADIVDVSEGLDSEIDVDVELDDVALDVISLEVDKSLEADEIVANEDEVKAPVESVPEIDSTAIDDEAAVDQYAILADDADEEIVEIFIEEAVEVLGELHTYVPQWKINHDDEEALAVVRRSFHTLKGSGRLLGAELIGEFSWKFENMLNRVIDKKIIVNDTLLQAIDEALAVLPQLIEQLKGNREPIENIIQLMSAADAVSDGREPELSKNADDAADEIIVVEEDLVENGLAEVDTSEAETETDGNFELEDISVQGVEDTTEEISIEIESDNDFEIIEEAIDIEITGEDAVEVDSEVVELDIASVEDDIIFDTGVLTEQSVSDEDEEALDISALETDVGSESENENEEVIDLSADMDISEVDDIAVNDVVTDDYEIEIEKADRDVVVTGELMDIDPMLLKIYYDESKSHADKIHQLLEDSRSQGKSLKADKTLMRAFHTLYGSARTAEVEAIADLSGPAEKYVKARQDGGEENIPDDVSQILAEVEQAISSMLDQVSASRLPEVNKGLQEKVNKIVQQEIQDQLQKSWQSNSTADSADTAKTINEQPVAVETDIIVDATPAATSVTEEVIVEELASDDASQETDLPLAVTEDEQNNKQEDKPPVQEEVIAVSYGDIDDELIDIFLEEAEELLESCETTLIEIKAAPNSADHIQQLQRNMHTLKGGARMADLAPIGDLTHNLESLVVMVAESKVETDKRLFDLFNESMDALAIMLACVKQRQPLTSVNDLIDRIGMLMRGEVAEQRSVERFDIDLSQLESGDEEELEEIDISSLLPDHKEIPVVEELDIVVEKIDDVSHEKDIANDPVHGDAVSAKKIQDNESSAQAAVEHPHWGERASDVNFKDSQEQVRVRSDLLNNLVNAAGEVNIYHARMGKQISDFGYNLAELSSTVVRLKEQLRNLEIETEIQIRSGYEKESDSFDDNFDPLEMDQYSTLQQLTRSLSETSGDVESINEILAEITRDSETLLVQESRISTDLQEGLMRTRMVRFGGLSSRLRRIVRQISRELGKEVELEIVGEDSEVDRTVLDRIIAPLEHMIRNAVAHGIETPDARKVLGKDETGKIVIEVDRQGTNIIIDMRDDGAGIDVDKIRQKSIEQGLISADADLSDHEALQFILHSGFSTADEVTQVSGRGVGMDVVDSEIKQLGGVLHIDTVRGKGTDFNIRLPLTLAINQALLVSASDDVFAVPLASIEGVVRITGLELQRFYDSGNSHYEFNGIEYELKHLGGLLTGHQQDYSKQLRLFPVLLVHVGEQHFALHVDDLIGRREIVVKPVGMQLGAIRGIAGATILADGRVVLILEMSALVVADSLFKQHVEGELSEDGVVEEIKTAADVKKTIMVVDDSITIRKVTERMLLRHGIEVILAKDGIDATNLLQDHIPDLMLLDIEMPRMDGFEVATYVRNEDRLKDIPIIMITSRTGSKHKEKAMKIGVNRYLGKPFQEDDLVSNINEILNTGY